MLNPTAAEGAPSSDRCELLCLDLPHAEQVRAGLPPIGHAQVTAGVFKALGDPQRLRIGAALGA